FTLTGSITNNSSNLETINESITLSGVRSFTPGTGGLNFGVALGGSGGFSIAGNGTVTLNASNSYTGTTAVNAGTLISGSNLISSSSALVMGGGTFQASQQTFANTTLNAGQARIISTSNTIALG